MNNMVPSNGKDQLLVNQTFDTRNQHHSLLFLLQADLHKPLSHNNKANCLKKQ